MRDPQVCYANATTSQVNSDCDIHAGSVIGQAQRNAEDKVHPDDSVSDNRKDCKCQVQALKQGTKTLVEHVHLPVRFVA